MQRSIRDDQILLHDRFSRNNRIYNRQRESRSSGSVERKIIFQIVRLSIITFKKLESECVLRAELHLRNGCRHVRLNYVRVSGRSERTTSEEQKRRKPGIRARDIRLLCPTDVFGVRD